MDNDHCYGLEGAINEVEREAGLPLRFATSRKSQISSLNYIKLAFRETSPQLSESFVSRFSFVRTEFSFFELIVRHQKVMARTSHYTHNHPFRLPETSIQAYLFRVVWQRGKRLLEQLAKRFNTF